MSAKKQIEKEIREAYIFLREKNMTVPSETLQFMLDASLEKLQGQSLPIDSVIAMLPTDADIEKYANVTLGMRDTLTKKKKLLKVVLNTLKTN